MNLKTTNYMLALEKLSNLIISGCLLSEEVFIVDDLDSILDGREETTFDEQWIRNYNVINEKRELIDFKTKEIIDSIRESAYKITYNFIQSPDLAGHVSDDFGLIAEALVLNHNDEWLNALGKAYAENKIPYGILKPLKGKLIEVLLGDEVI